MKNSLRLLWIALIAVVLSSCVGNKKLVYLQDKEAKGSERYFSDALTKSNELAYRIQPGTEAYNLLLSQRRADELKELLVDKYGIDSGRIEAVGIGENPSSDPVEARRARIINNIIDRIRKRPCIRVGLFRYFEWR